MTMRFHLDRYAQSRMACRQLAPPPSARKRSQVASQRGRPAILMSPNSLQNPRLGRQKGAGLSLPDTRWIGLVQEMTDVPFRVSLKGDAGPAATVPGRSRWLVRAGLAVALVGAACWLGYALAFSRGLDR